MEDVFEDAQERRIPAVVSAEGRPRHRKYSGSGGSDPLEAPRRHHALPREVHSII